MSAYNRINLRIFSIKWIKWMCAAILTLSNCCLYVDTFRIDVHNDFGPILISLVHWKVRYILYCNFLFPMPSEI